LDEVSAATGQQLVGEDYKTWIESKKMAGLIQ
jgi:hypothetical protein